MTAIALKTPGLRVPGTRCARHWRAWVVLAAMAALWVVAGLSVAMQSVVARPALAAPSARRRSPACAPPCRRPRRPSCAGSRPKTRSRSTPRSRSPASPIRPARPFLLGRSGAADRLRSLDCLTAAIYYEAATEPTRRPARGRPGGAEPGPPPGLSLDASAASSSKARGASTGCQFSFSCDGSLRRAPMADYWERARRVARGGARRLRLCAGRLGDPLSRQLCRALLGLEPGQVGHRRHATSSIAGAAAGAGRPPSSTAMPGAEPAIAWRGGFGQPMPLRARSWRRARATPPRRQAAAEAAPMRQRRQLPARGAAPLRAAAARHRQCGDRRAHPRRPQPHHQPALGADRQRHRPAAAGPARPPHRRRRAAARAPGRALSLGSGAAAAEQLAPRRAAERRARRHGQPSARRPPTPRRNGVQLALMTTVPAFAGMTSQQAAESSRRSPARFISAFCSFSNARTSIWRMRSRLTS